MPPQMPPPLARLVEFAEAGCLPESRFSLPNPSGGAPVELWPDPPFRDCGVNRAVAAWGAALRGWADPAGAWRGVLSAEAREGAWCRTVSLLAELEKELHRRGWFK